jgi:cytochrome c553
MTKTGQCGVLAFGGFVALVALATGCGPPVPASPSYQADVRPIFMSHCVRCHGAGGTLNQTYEPTGADAAPLASDPARPLKCYLNQYADTGCAAGDAGTSATCHRGADYCATLANGIGFRIHGGPPVPMPPAPAPKLNDWEMKVVDAWLSNPICSNAATPDPTICPPGVGP